MLETPVIRQQLFSARTPEGSMLYLAFVEGGGCAIMRDQEVLETWDETQPALDHALDRFMELARITQE